MSEWQPIETAPKEETEILTFDALDALIIICVWWDEMGWVDAQEFLPRQPTHWMPLPSPPATP